MFWNYGFGWGFPFFWMIIWVLVIVLLWGRWHRGGHHSHWQREKSAEEILSDRFARGEIDEDEYKNRLEVLRKHSK